MKKKPASTSAEEGDALSQTHTHLCAIGASAGGVEALQKFFASVADDLGLAFVVIVHLAPDQPSSLSDILAARTKMPVHQVDHSAQLNPNCVYVIPPDRELIIQGDDLTARRFSEPRGRRFPIDMFFQSVAAGRGDGIAVLLSGTGSDGSLGARAVREAGGIVFAQDPHDAGYGAMPESAIATGAVDFVAPIEELTARIAQVMLNEKAFHSATEEESEQDVRQIINFLRLRTQHDFSSYKQPTVLRRIARRMQVTRQESLSDYSRYLQDHSKEVQELFSDLLISVTMFFRDPQAFDALAKKAIEPIFDRLDGNHSIRVWVVGCATGEEAYSIGILLLEESDRRGIRPAIQIFASDIDESAIAAAREGLYPKAIESQVTDERLRRFFIEHGSFYRVRQELRELVLFSVHSVLKDPPFIRLDLISCRNLLIYLQRELQHQVCALFHYALKPHGYLFLGPAEMADPFPGLFTAFDRDSRIYTAVTSTERAAPVLPQLTSDYRFLGVQLKPPPEVEQAIGIGQAHASALERSAPPSALVDNSGRILHLSPTTGRFFRPQEGPFTAEISTQVRPELRVDLKLALRRALEQGDPTLTLPIATAFNGERRLVSLHAVPVGDGESSVRRALVFFLDAGSAQPTDETIHDENIDRVEVSRLRQELSAAQDRLAASRGEYERATQELRAANEELQSINEEYRSTAEELETSKEELQSMNEELQTVNGELKSKLTAISASHNNLQNLIASTEVGTLFLDLDFKIKLFTPPISQYFNIAEADTGRAISNFTHRLVDEELERDAADVLKNLTPIEKEVRTTDGKWVLLRMRPYRTSENRIEGVVLTLADITRLKLAEQGLATELQAMERFQQLSTKVVEAERLEDPLKSILDAISELLSADFGAIQLYEKENQTLKIAAERGFGERFLERYATVNVSPDSARSTELANCQQVAFADVEKESAYAPRLEEATAAGYRAVISTPLCDSSGRVAGVLTSHFTEPHQFSKHELRLTDICARLAADAIRAYSMHKELREADRRKNEFLAVLAHEVRNPLAAISSASRILERASPSTEEMKRFHQMIEHQVTHLARLVEDLLDISRITRGKIVLRLELVELNDILREALAGSREQIDQKGHKLKMSLSEVPILVHGDHVRLVQIITNLLDNAAKYTPAQGTIEISTKREDGFALVSVRDSGVGIAAQMIPKVFELFERVEPELGVASAGIGVGLALVRSLTSLHGGTIEVVSDGVGKGSEFVVRLPLASTALVTEEESERIHSSIALSREVLVVDDNKDVAEGLAMLLRDCGADVRTACGGPEGLSAVTKFRPDIAFINLSMPTIDGYELARRIKAAPGGQDIILAAITGWSDDEHRQRARESGFDNYFVKPISIDQLQSLLTARRKKG